MSSETTSIESQFNINPPKLNSSNIYEFDRFRLDVVLLMLYEDEISISLAPKVVETLLALIEKHGQIISKDELMNRLWGDSFVEQSNLTQNIYLLRKTLGNGADGNPLIETFRRRGYRFNGTLKPNIQRESFDAKTASSNKSGNILPKPNRRMIFVFFSIAVVIVVILSVFGWQRFYLRQSSSDGANNSPLQSLNITLKSLTPGLYIFNPVISPNGELLAYSESDGKGGNALWVKDLSREKTTQLLPPVVKGYLGLQFSPDGKYLYFLLRKPKVAFSNIARIPIGGGTPEEIVKDVVGWFSLSPDNNQIAFVRDTKLIIAQINNGNERAVAERSGKTRWFVSLDCQPAWSPDAQYIATCGGYNEQGRKFSELVEVNVGTGAERRILTPNWNQIGTVAWAANGKDLFVTAREEIGKPLQIWRLSYPQGAVTKITNDLHNYNSLSLSADSKSLVAGQTSGQSGIWLTSFNDTEPPERFSFDESENIGVGGLSFTPDGRIIFTSSQKGNIDLWIMNADGTNQKQLTSNMGGWNGRPRVTSDNHYIVFQSFYSDKNHIWRIDLDGGNPIQLTQSETECCPNISPDGQWIYFSVDTDNTNSIFKISINGGDPIRISQIKNISSPSISPDGKLMAFELLSENSQSRKMGVMSLETGEILKVFDIFVFRRTIYWTLDSKSLIYISENDTSNLWQQPLDGGSPTQLTHFPPEQIRDFAVSQDFKKIAVIRKSLLNEAILINNF
jgi:Tol biopolymer transport system component/DNA-binding winged helix-turn-helix (wHTH) protein